MAVIAFVCCYQDCPIFCTSLYLFKKSNVPHLEKSDSFLKKEVSLILQNLSTKLKQTNILVSELGNHWPWCIDSKLEDMGFP
jgi:hypothetical protein